MMTIRQGFMSREKYLSQFESVVHFVFERTHLHFADQLLLDLRVAHDGRKELAEVRQQNAHLIVDGRVERRQRQPVIAEVRVAEHLDENRHDHRPQYLVVRLTGIRQREPECRNQYPADDWVLLFREVILQYQSQ